QHMYEAFHEAKADACLAASIFHYGECTVGDVKRFLKEKGVSVRL
ncbi:MAG: imidazole glycerol phosphate synthase subunit HisF, partial [Candidatus Bathyarchaeia archaeon]